MAQEPPPEDLLTGVGYRSKKNQLSLRKWLTRLQQITHTLGYKGGTNWIYKVIFKRCHEVVGLQVKS